MLLLDVVVSTSLGVLLLPRVAPRGFNTFDSYNPTLLNTTSVKTLANYLATTLLPSGYDTLCLDGGWSITHKSYTNGTTYEYQNMDGNGHSIAAPERFADIKALSNAVRAKGLKFGLWTIRGVHSDAVKLKLPITGTPYTVDELVDVLPVGHGANGSCLWASEWLGVNATHPAAQAYYDQKVAVLVSQGADFIKADCMMCGPCYTSEMEMMASAVKRSPAHITLSLSPGGGNQPSDGVWAARETIGTMYRITTDFHGGWYGWGGLQQSLFIAGNFSAAHLYGANKTYPDSDMLPLAASWWSTTGAFEVVAGGDVTLRDLAHAHGAAATAADLDAVVALNSAWVHDLDAPLPRGQRVQLPRDQPEQADRGQTIISAWIMAGSPLMQSGRPIPIDNVTISYLTNTDALALHKSASRGATRVVNYRGNCTCVGGAGSCTIPHINVSAHVKPCVATWATVGAAVMNQRRSLPWHAAALINMGETSAPAVHTSFAALGINASSVAEVLDIWTGEALPIERGGFTIKTLRPHATALVKVLLSAQRIE